MHTCVTFFPLYKPVINYGELGGYRTGGGGGQVKFTPTKKGTQKRF